MRDFTALKAESAPYPADLPMHTAIARWTHGISPLAVTSAVEDWALHLTASPGKQAELIQSAAQKTAQWWTLWQSMLSTDAPTSLTKLLQDRRFKPAPWRTPPFELLAQGFLLTQQWWHEATTGVRGVSAHHEAVVEFVTRQWLDMASPSNFIATNPQVLEETLRTGGKNLSSGAMNWWRDAMAVLTNQGPAGAERFAPGKTVAITPGKVVFANRLMELIRYAPSTATVYPEPVLMVPSWIMKYYILDLSPENSMVRFLVDQGHTVFMISWKNPESADRDLGMIDYLQSGVLDALQAVRALCPQAPIHAVGYCLGGTLLSIAAALLARQAPTLLKTLTLLAAQTDFEEPGELGLFIDESQIAFLENLMAKHGTLDGRQMAGAFALINSKDLVWSKLVHEYLMGAQTPLTDLRAWNADATRLPARMHSEYLRRLYLHNDLAQGRYLVQGKPVALQGLHLPIFAVGTERDHVSPWQSVYKIHLLTDSEISFVLTRGGHNVGIVNPVRGPLKNPEAGYRIGLRAEHGSYLAPQEWALQATPHRGSWWQAWHEWLATHSGQRIKPPTLRGHGLPPGQTLVDAPGRYVHAD